MIYFYLAYVEDFPSTEASPLSVKYISSTVFFYYFYFLLQEQRFLQDDLHWHMLFISFFLYFIFFVHLFHNLNVLKPMLHMIDLVFYHFNSDCDCSVCFSESALWLCAGVLSSQLLPLPCVYSFIIPVFNCFFFKNKAVAIYKYLYFPNINVILSHLTAPEYA